MLGLLTVRLQGSATSGWLLCSLFNA